MSNLFCFICFSKDHQFVDCIYAVPNLFLPNVDKNLFTRFIEFFAIEEKLFLMFSYPKIFATIKKKPFTVMRSKSIMFSKLKYYLDLDLDLIIVKSAEVQNSYINRLKSRIAFRIEHLEITSPFIVAKANLQLSSNELFLLLTFKTKTIKCKNIEFQPRVFFHQIVEAAPILEEIDIYETNIEVDNTWVDLLSKLKYLKKVSLEIPDLNVNVANLADLIQKNNMELNLSIIISHQRGVFNENEAIKAIKNRLSSHFFLCQISEWDCPLSICFKYDVGLSEELMFKVWEH